MHFSDKRRVQVGNMWEYLDCSAAFDTLSEMKNSSTLDKLGHLFKVLLLKYIRLMLIVIFSFSACCFPRLRSWWEISSRSPSLCVSAHKLPLKCFYSSSLLHDKNFSFFSWQSSLLFSLKTSRFLNLPSNCVLRLINL